MNIFGDCCMRADEYPHVLVLANRWPALVRAAESTEMTADRWLFFEVDEENGDKKWSSRTYD